jgi:transcriptional regulator with XRE-family HTH domain
MSSIGSDIRDRRKALGLTQGALSRLAEIDQSRVTEIETGATKDPRASTLEKLYRALGVTLPWDTGRYPLSSLAA